MSPKVSVIIPNYNHERYLPLRINSVINQTYTDFELLILDDRSQDDSRTLIREYAKKDPRIQIHFNEQNSGSPFKQWNKGVRLSKGEFIWIAESDDYADEKLLEKLVNILETNKQVGVAYCQSHVVNEKNEIIDTMKRWTDELDPNRWAQNYENNGRNECRDYMAYKATIPNASAVVFRKEHYLAAGQADETFRACGDWFTWINILLRCDVFFLAEPLNYFRRHNQSTRIYKNHDKVIMNVAEQYRILKLLLDSIKFTRQEKNRLIRYYFDRSFELLPIRLKFSPKFLQYLSIVANVDHKVYFRSAIAILVRLITYLPEKLLRNNP
uniref:Glycosyltransferase n=1 Tax=Roseihalotalea indica TaxID=2867963 RepID=A0AA49JJZ0_9BACT|nr:glycosyltransferase [Tunicatimonas sp. TK19036]